MLLAISPRRRECRILAIYLPRRLDARAAELRSRPQERPVRNYGGGVRAAIAEPHQANGATSPFDGRATRRRRRAADAEPSPCVMITGSEDVAARPADGRATWRRRRAADAEPSPCVAITGSEDVAERPADGRATLRRRRDADAGPSQRVAIDLYRRRRGGNIDARAADLHRWRQGRSGRVFFDDNCAAEPGAPASRRPLSWRNARGSNKVARAADLRSRP